MSIINVPSVTGLPPYGILTSPPSFPYRGGWACHSWHINSFSSYSLYNIWCLLGRQGVTSPVTEAAHLSRFDTCDMIYDMDSYEVHPTWSAHSVPLFTGTLAECQSFCYKNIITFKEVNPKSNYPFRLKIGEQNETDQTKV